MYHQNISISGATDKAKYLMSFNYFNQQGIVLKHLFKKLYFPRQHFFQYFERYPGGGKPRLFHFYKPAFRSPDGLLLL